jgi:heat-inducible transcriptional repressor
MSVTTSNKRKSSILEALTRLYIDTAHPVSSSLIKERFSLSISSATIRNILADLEELGYIIQPHTSSGRIPTDKGYRFYIDSLMKRQSLKDGEKRKLKQACLSSARKTQEIIDKTSEILAEISQEAAINFFFNLNESVLKHIELINISLLKVLVILITDSGIVRNYIVNLNEPMSASELQRISNFLNENLRDVSLVDIKQKLYTLLNRQNLVYMQLAHEACRIFDALETDEIFEKDYDIHQDGINNIMNQPEFCNVECLRDILDVLESKDRLAEILRASLEPNFSRVKVMIGKENSFKGLQNCSLITAGYKIKDKTVGLLGLLGPTRMAYARMLPLVEYMAEVMTETLTDLTKDEDSR